MNHVINNTWFVDAIRQLDRTWGQYPTPPPWTLESSCNCFPLQRTIK